MLKLKINEIFYSLQCEGSRTGEPSIFIRLTDCNLTCGFCDTEFESGKVMTLDDIYRYIQQFKGNWIVWTGGEPTLQLTEKIVEYFKLAGYKQAIETNGSNPVPNVDYICVSPKVAEHVIKKNFKVIDELRYVRNDTQSIPKPAVKAVHNYLSPTFQGDKVDGKALNHCIELVKENPEWKLSIQAHKLLNIQ